MNTDKTHMFVYRYHDHVCKFIMWNAEVLQLFWPFLPNPTKIKITCNKPLKTSKVQIVFTGFRYDALPNNLDLIASKEKRISRRFDFPGPPWAGEHWKKAVFLRILRPYAKATRLINLYQSWRDESECWRMLFFYLQEWSIWFETWKLCRPLRLKYVQRMCSE